MPVSATTQKSFVHATAPCLRLMTDQSAIRPEQESDASREMRDYAQCSHEAQTRRACGHLVDHCEIVKMVC